MEDLPRRVDMAENSIPADMSWPVYNIAFYLSHHLVLCYQPREESMRSRDVVAGEAGEERPPIHFRQCAFRFYFRIQSLFYIGPG